MRKQLAIKGHEARGNEVIEILEMFGASNKHDYRGCYPTTLYVLNDNNIDLVYTCDCENQEIFKLEDFLRKYPFKIGDKVINDDYSGYGIITEMVWDSVEWCVKYYVNFYDVGIIRWFKCDEIKISDVRGYIYDIEETSLQGEFGLQENKINGIFFSNENYANKVELCLGNDYEVVVEGNKTFVQRKKPKYPKNYEECCGVLGMTYDFPDIKMVSIDEYYLYSEFIRLIRCRDAYWKVAGEQMGLGKSWEPDWDNLSTNHEFIKISKGCFTYSSRVLVFPTKEMCDEFFKNFKELIEKCKKLL